MPHLYLNPLCTMIKTMEWINDLIDYNYGKLYYVWSDFYKWDKLIIILLLIKILFTSFPVRLVMAVYILFFKKIILLFKLKNNFVILFGQSMILWTNANHGFHLGLFFHLQLLIQFIILSIQGLANKLSLKA